MRDVAQWGEISGLATPVLRREDMAMLASFLREDIFGVL